MGTYTYPKFPYTAPADLQADAPQRRPLIIVGAGPVGLARAPSATPNGRSKCSTAWAWVTPCATRA